MTTSLRLYITLLLAMTLIGCEEVVDLGVDFDPQVVVVSEIAPDRPLTVSLSYAQPILSREPITYIEMAEVSLTNTMTEFQFPLLLERPTKDTLNPNLPDHPYFLSEETITENRQDAYELSVEVPGETTITAVTDIPPPVSLNELTLDRFVKNSDPREEDIYNVEVSFNFDHNEFVGQDYHLVFYFRFLFFEAENRDTVYFIRTQIPELQKLNTSIPYSTDFENGALLQGKDLRNGQHQLSAELAVDFTEDLSPFPPQLVVELRNTSKDYSQYHLALSRQLVQRDSILSQAVVIPSNIENGLGLFGGYNYDIEFINLTN